MYTIKEHNPKIMWSAKGRWKRWLRRDGKITFYSTKKKCEETLRCDAEKIRVFID